MKYFVTIIIMFSLLGCSKKFCDEAHKSLKAGADTLEVRWECKVQGCIYKQFNKVVDNTFCINNKDTQSRLAASLVCTAVIQAAAVLGTSLIAIPCQCNARIVYTDLSAPAAICPAFALLP